MSERILIEPDEQFVQMITDRGGDDLKLCSQCATCSVSCNITPLVHPFPRKEMIWMQWGLKNRLLADPDIWACHQCNDCSVNCPRQAKPGDIFASIREYAFRHFAVPGFFGTLVSSPKYLPVLFLIPAVVLLGVLSVFGNLEAWGGADGEFSFSKVFPWEVIDKTFIAVALVTVVLSLSGLARFWKQLRIEPSNNGLQRRSLIGSAVAAIAEFLAHKQFNGCNNNIKRTTGHLLTFYGFLGLAVTSGIVWVLLLLNPDVTPLPLWHPAKILGNLSLVAVCAGLVILYTMRVSGHEKVGRSTYADWLFLGVLGSTILTGFLSQLIRVMELYAAANTVYFVHLVFVFCLIVYLPYTKFAHMLFRLTAITYNKYMGRG